jgi:hypothetical protein
MYICTLPRTQAIAAVALLTLSLPLPAQSRRTNSNRAQAELHINVTVVPAVAPPRHHKDKDRDVAAVSYDLRPYNENISVKEEMHPMLVTTGNSQARQEQVRIITVVLK